MTTLNKLLAFTLFASVGICEAVAPSFVPVRVDNQSVEYLVGGYGHISSFGIYMRYFEAEPRSFYSGYLPVPNGEQWLVTATKHQVCVAKLPFSKQKPPKQQDIFSVTLGFTDQCPTIEFAGVSETMRPVRLS